jgi:hypothetical protein
LCKPFGLLINVANLTLSYYYYTQYEIIFKAKLMIISSGRHGLGNASNADRAIWEEFNSNWDKLAFESEQLLEKIVDKKTRVSKKIISDAFVEGKERESVVRVRVTHTEGSGLFCCHYLASSTLSLLSHSIQSY